MHRRIAQRPRDGIEQPELRLVGRQRRRAAVTGSRAQLRKQLGQLERVRREARPRGARDAEQRAQHLNERPIRGCSARLPAATPENVDVAVGSVARDLLEQAALTDAGLAGDEPERPAAVERVADGGGELLQLSEATYEGAGAHWRWGQHAPGGSEASS